MTVQVTILKGLQSVTPYPNFENIEKINSMSQLQVYIMIIVLATQIFKLVIFIRNQHHIQIVNNKLNFNFLRMDLCFSHHRLAYWSIVLQTKSKLYLLQQNQDISMSNNNDSSLLGFLQKKSLFSSSPNKGGRRRSRSKSRDSRNYDKKSIANSFEERSLEESIAAQKRQVYQQSGNRFYYTNVDNQKPFNSYQAPNTYYDERVNNPQSYKAAPLFEEKSSSQPFKINQKANEANLWGGILQSASSFESARVESAQCLESLSFKISNEISSVNYKIEAFNSKVGRLLSSQMNAVREKIAQIFDAAFKESEKYMRQYIKAKQTELAGDLIRMKQVLQKERVKVDSMKEQLAKPAWRKVAGQILSSQIEAKVEEIVMKSRNLQVGHWQLGDIAGYRIKNIENQLKEIIKLKI